MYTFCFVGAIVIGVFALTLILFSESKQGRSSDEKKVNPWGAFAEIIGALIMLADGVFVGAALLDKEPQTAIWNVAHPEELKKAILEEAGVTPSPSSNVDATTPIIVPVPGLNKVHWDASTRTLKFDPPPPNTFWVISYGGNTLSLMGGSHILPDGIENVELYHQSMTGNTTSVVVSFPTPSK